ncbi:hypothetical protein VIGAN_01272500 [Vigna angularis var. angularis]|uniref:Uncharacterized protein n=2 Tax=Vigna TaxID=3913 RepID=A0A0S3R2X8_PHAAN|nr:hypothetical protein VIGAN_01272500 [Vigna angularis var. angularis]
MCELEAPELRPQHRRKKFHLLPQLLQLFLQCLSLAFSFRLPLRSPPSASSLPPPPSLFPLTLSILHSTATTPCSPLGHQSSEPPLSTSHSKIAQPSEAT